MNTPPSPDFGVLCDETRFWVVHRREYFGPFDYQWSSDLYGIELLFQQEKYGECCNSEQFFADLKPYRLPERVSQVAIIVSAGIISCLLESISGQDRLDSVARLLRETGLSRYRMLDKTTWLPRQNEEFPGRDEWRS